MKNDYINIYEHSLEFKNIISGPAPVGRMLNYLILAGKGDLKHKNGFRETNLDQNIGSAWCIEFMVGLGIVKYFDNGSAEIMPVVLTEPAKQIYGLLSKVDFLFDESKNPDLARNQLLGFSEDAYVLFKALFKRSVVCRNLYIYLDNRGSSAIEKSVFYDEYFGFFKKLYINEEYSREPDHSGATTGGNRVPSLCQLCRFFGAVIEKNNHLIFDLAELSCDEDVLVTFTDILQFQKELEKAEKRDIKIIEDMEERYGYDGNVTREIVQRNSSIQALFRQNLISKCGLKCAVCHIGFPDLLIASHIVPSAESDVFQKADHENGLVLCANHDKLFDHYLISFDSETGDILISEKIKNQICEFGLNGRTSLDESLLTEKRKNFLAIHNEKFKQKQEL